MCFSGLIVFDDFNGLINVHHFNWMEPLECKDVKLNVSKFCMLCQVWKLS